MVMKNSTATYNSKTRKDISNPHHGMPYKELLEKAGVKNIANNYTIQTLPNGKIIVKEKTK